MYVLVLIQGFHKILPRPLHEIQYALNSGTRIHLLASLADLLENSVVADRVISLNVNKLSLKVGLHGLNTLGLVENTLNSAGAPAAGHGNIELVVFGHLGTKCVSCIRELFNQHEPHRINSVQDTQPLSESHS